MESLKESVTWHFLRGCRNRERSTGSLNYFWTVPQRPPECLFLQSSRQTLVSSIEVNSLGENSLFCQKSKVIPVKRCLHVQSLWSVWNRVRTKNDPSSVAPDSCGKNPNTTATGNSESTFGVWARARLNREWWYRDNKIKEINDSKKSFKPIFTPILPYLQLKHYALIMQEVKFLWVS